MTSFLLRYFFIVFTACILPFEVAAQFSPSAVNDTTQDASQPDSLQRSFIVPIPLVGSIDRSLNASKFISDSAKNFTDYRYVMDLLGFFPGIFTREFGSPGQFSDATNNGLGPQEIAFLNDGVRLNDPLFGTYNPYLFPTEHIERIERVSGTQAFLYGLNSTGGAINVISKSKKAIRPYSRLRYSESAQGYSFVDGMVSQDIIRGLNITAGAQHTTFGPRFANSDEDAWNARMKVRYNINSNINLFLSEIYNQTQVGLNGGIDVFKTPDSLRFERLQATVRNTDAYEKITRHDLQVGAAMRLLCDSNAITTVTLSLSSNLREFRDEENRPTSNGIFFQQDQRSQWTGIKINHQQKIGTNVFDGGIELQSQRTLVTPATEERRATLFNAYGKIELLPLHNVTITPYARFDHYMDENRLSFGGDGVLSLTPCFHLIGGYARTFRFPTFEELYGLDTLLTSTLWFDSPEEHHLIEGGIRWKHGDAVFLEVTAFHRTIFKPIVVGVPPAIGTQAPYEFRQQEKEILQGVNGSATFRIGSFFLEGSAQFIERTNHDDETLIFPKLTAIGGAYYWDKLFGGHLNLKAGLRGRFFSEYVGREFNQQALVYVPGGQSYNIPATATLDIVILAHIGDAYIHFIWDNVIDKEYIMMAFYPMTQRAIRFGVSWEFMN